VGIEDTYLYESNTGFSAEIVVDDLGLVTAYPGGWERIAALLVIVCHEIDPRAHWIAPHQPSIVGL